MEYCRVRDVWLEIFGYLPVQSYWSVALTCRYWWAILSQSRRYIHDQRFDCYDAAREGRVDMLRLMAFKERRYRTLRRWSLWDWKVVAFNAGLGGHWDAIEYCLLMGGVSENAIEGAMAGGHKGLVSKIIEWALFV